MTTYAIPFCLVCALPFNIADLDDAQRLLLVEISILYFDNQLRVGVKWNAVTIHAFELWNSLNEGVSSSVVGGVSLCLPSNAFAAPITVLATGFPFVRLPVRLTYLSPDHTRRTD